MLFHVETMKLAMALLVSSAYLLDVVSGKGVAMHAGGGSKVGIICFWNYSSKTTFSN